MYKAERRIARSLMMKARNIVDKETVTHTGILRSDIRMKPRGKHWTVVAGELAPYAWIIEHGRKPIAGYKFVPTQLFPLEGFAVPAMGRVIRGAKGIKFMTRATIHATEKSPKIVTEELERVRKESGDK